MSRIGKKPIVIPAGVTVDIDNKNHVLIAKGTLGDNVVEILPCCKITIADNMINLKLANDVESDFKFLGLTRTLVNNAVVGVSSGFVRKLIITGIGFKASVSGKTLTLNLGFSHPVNYNFPDDIDITVIENNQIVVKGIDKQKVGQVAAEIRSFRKPEPYKGKGIRYEDEIIKRKAGKTSSK